LKIGNKNVKYNKAMDECKRWYNSNIGAMNRGRWNEAWRDGKGEYWH
jgi:hypothetical protein